MKYQAFLDRFGASVRTKNILQPGEDAPAKALRNMRPHRLPAQSEIAPEFIRLDPWEAEYLFAVAARARQGIVETGRFHGGSSFVMACANDAVPIWSIDIDPQDDDGLRRVLEGAGVGGNVELIVGDSQRTRYDRIGDFDVLFVDGDHSYDGCMADLENWYPLLSAGGHVVIHDCYDGQPSMDATFDFFARHDATAVVPAFRGPHHWWHPAGSMGHYVKR